mmetsp:Transcript_2604/g.6569  ORF Transcript_2604/g.6569 Transcript_2604/m.6569 type:complete len:211 (+) Transcript_2604:1493-2125(+)
MPVYWHWERRHCWKQHQKPQRQLDGVVLVVLLQLVVDCSILLQLAWHLLKHWDCRVVGVAKIPRTKPQHWDMPQLVEDDNCCRGFQPPKHTDSVLAAWLLSVGPNRQWFQAVQHNWHPLLRVAKHPWLSYLHRLCLQDNLLLLRLDRECWLVLVLLQVADVDVVDTQRLHHHHDTVAVLHRACILPVEHVVVVLVLLLVLLVLLVLVNKV